MPSKRNPSSPTNHVLYNTWKGMLARCYNVNHISYKHYGGRGIDVCKEWLADFQLFVKDVGERPNGYTLDRIDCNSNYNPDNVRWADRYTQNRNKRDRSPIIRLFDEDISLRAASLKYGISCAILKCRIERKMSDEDIVLPMGQIAKRYIHCGERYTLRGLASIAGITQEAMRLRVKRGLTGEDLVRPPARR